MKFTLIGILSLVLLSACSRIEDDPQQAELAKLIAASPVEDAKGAILQQDFRFVAVHNHHLIMPNAVPACLVEKYGYFILSNEQFEYGSYPYQTYGATAQIYANWYNNELLLHLEVHTLDQC